MEVPALKSLFLAPRSVAFVGIPRKSGPGSLNPLDNLRAWGYEGRIHLVHPHVREIAGLRTVDNVSSIEDQVDLAVISTPRETVPGIVQACAQGGIRALIVTNQGFAEADARGRELQKAMVEAANAGGARILGPNTLGVSNAFDGFTSSFMPLKRETSPIGVVCQSGVFFVGSRHLTGGVGMGVDVGNGCDLDIGDGLEWLGCDPRLRVIAIHAEGIPSGRRFIESARDIARRIPIVALKTGRSKSGARVAASHSGSMAGEDRVVHAALGKAGIVRAEETQDLHDLVQGFLRLPPMRGTRVAVVTLTGAGGVILLDAIESAGLKPATLSAATLEGVQNLSPPWMPISNPMDIWPALMKHGMTRVYRMALGDALRDPRVDGVICAALGLGLPERDHLDVVEVIQDLSENAGKPVLAWFYGPEAEEARVRLKERGRALSVTHPERGARLLALMARYERWRTETTET